MENLVAKKAVEFAKNNSLKFFNFDEVGTQIDPNHYGVVKLTNIKVDGEAQTVEAIVYLPNSEVGGEYGDIEFSDF